MNLDDAKPLLAFATVLETGSMQAAGKALGISASAVSQHVSRLEALHRVKLLHRSTRRLTPTDAGLALRAHCHRLRQTLLLAQEALESLKSEASGKLHLALASSLVQAPAFCRSLSLLSRHYPGIQPVLHIDDTLTPLAGGAIDIAIRGGDHALEAPGLVARPLAHWRWRILAAPDYLDRHPSIRQPDDLLSHTWLHYRDQRQTLILQRGDTTQSLRLPPGLVCDQLAAVSQLAMAGFGLCLQLSGEAQKATEDGRLHPLLPDWKLPGIHLYAVTPQRAQSAKVRVALEILHQAFAGGASGSQA